MPMTDLEIFDFVAAHLIRQGKQSRCGSAGDLYNTCMYHGPHGTSCAVGCLIKDELYDPAMEGVQIQNSPKVRAAVKKSIGRKLTDTTREMLVVLQCVHDRYKPRDWPERLEADRRELFPDAPTPE